LKSESHNTQKVQYLNLSCRRYLWKNAWKIV